MASRFYFQFLVRRRKTASESKKSENPSEGEQFFKQHKKNKTMKNDKKKQIEMKIMLPFNLPIEKYDD